MFPTYNTEVPLGKQDYYPNQSAAPAMARMRQAVGGPSLQQQDHNGISAIPVPDKKEADKKETPLRRTESVKRQTAFSTPEQLEELWSVANGKAGEQAADTYTLELSW